MYRTETEEGLYREYMPDMTDEERELEEHLFRLFHELDEAVKAAVGNRYHALLGHRRRNRQYQEGDYREILKLALEEHGKFYPVPSLVDYSFEYEEIMLAQDAMS